MTISAPATVSVLNTASANPICSGTSVTYTATPTNGGTSPVYQWKVNGTVVGTSASTYSYTPVNGDAVVCLLTSNATCVSAAQATSNTVNQTVYAIVPVSVSISTASNTVCSGTSTTFSAVPVYGGASPTYQWKVNGSAVSAIGSTLSYSPVNNDVVTCVLTSGLMCTTGSPATSNAVTMTVNPMLPVSISISASTNSINAGTIVNYTAMPVNGGSSPVYQWSINSMAVGSNSSLFSYAPANNDTVSCLLTSSATCISGSPALSNKVVMIVNTSSLATEPLQYPVNFSAHNIHLQWADASGAINPDGYLIRMSSVGFSSIADPVDGTAYTDSSDTQNVAYGVQSAWFKNLNPNTTYYFKLFGYTMNGAGVNYKTDGSVPQVQQTTGY